MKPTLTIPLDIYDTNVHVFYDREKYGKWEKEKLGDKPSEIPSHWSSFFSRVLVPSGDDDGLHTLYRVICIDPDELLLAASHEATHIVFDFCDDVKIPIRYDNSEVVAYLIGFISEKIIKYALSSYTIRDWKAKRNG